MGVFDGLRSGVSNFTNDVTKAKETDDKVKNATVKSSRLLNSINGGGGSTDSVSIKPTYGPSEGGTSYSGDTAVDAGTAGPEEDHGYGAPDKASERLDFALNPERRTESNLRNEQFTGRLKEDVRNATDLTATNLRNLSGTAQDIGTQAGDRLGGISNFQLGSGFRAGQTSRDIMDRDAPDTDFTASIEELNQAGITAEELAEIERTQGPSAAQAMLRSALNQSSMSNLALARSGTGFGQSASALTQALDKNAIAGIEATNQAAQLRAQEEAQRRQRLASNLAVAAGIDMQTAEQLTQQSEFKTESELLAERNRDAASAQFTGLEQQGFAGAAGSTAQGASIGLQSVQTAGGLETGASGQTLAGASFELGVESAVEDADRADADRILAFHGIERGVAVANAGKDAQTTAAYIGAAATVVAAGAAIYATGGAAAPVAAPAAASSLVSLGNGIQGDA